MTTVPQLIANQIKNGAEGMARYVKAMPEDKVTWKTLDAGRDARCVHHEWPSRVRLSSWVAGSRLPNGRSGRFPARAAQ